MRMCSASPPRSAPTSPPASSARPRAATGRGDELEPVETRVWPERRVLLVNPRRAAFDRRRFRRLGRASTAGPLGDWRDGPQRSRRRRRVALVPGDRRRARRARPAPGFARMSGSGATCFGLFDSEARSRPRRRPDRRRTSRLVAVPNQASLTRRSRNGTVQLAAVNHRNPQDFRSGTPLASCPATGRGAVVIAPTFARGLPPPPDGTPRNNSAGLPRNGQPGLFLRDKARRAPACPRPCSGSHATPTVARLTLDRPEARNAIPAAGWAELGSGSARSLSATSRLLVVTGAGGAFCAGADLNDFAAMRGDEAAVARFRVEMRAALDALRLLAIPTVAVDRRRLLRRRRRARHGLRHPDRGECRGFRDHAGEDRHLLPAGGRASTGRT